MKHFETPWLIWVVFIFFFSSGGTFVHFKELTKSYGRAYIFDVSPPSALAFTLTLDRNNLFHSPGFRTVDFIHFNLANNTVYSNFQIHFHINSPTYFFRWKFLALIKAVKAENWLILESWLRIWISSVIGWWKIGMFSSNYDTKGFHCFIRSDVFCWNYSLKWHNKSTAGSRQPNILLLTKKYIRKILCFCDIRG